MSTGHAENIPEWDNTQAFTEGWGIFRMCPPIHPDEPFQIEGLSNPELVPGSELPFDEDDEGAWKHVKRKAAEGSAYHQAAIDYIKQNSPREWENFKDLQP